METETTLETHVVEKVGTLKILRVFDFEALAKEYPDSIPTEALRDAGAYTVEIQPKGRGVDSIRVRVASPSEGEAYLEGFDRCARLLRRKPRAPNGGGVGGNSGLARMTKGELTKLAKSKKPACVVVAAKGEGFAVSKGDLIAAIAAHEKKHPVKGPKG